MRQASCCEIVLRNLSFHDFSWHMTVNHVRWDFTTSIHYVCENNEIRSRRKCTVSSRWELCAAKISQWKQKCSQTWTISGIEDSSGKIRRTRHISRGQILFSILNAHARMRRERLKRVRRREMRSATVHLISHLSLLVERHANGAVLFSVNIAVEMCKTDLLFSLTPMYVFVGKIAVAAILVRYPSARKILLVVRSDYSASW